MASWFYPVLVLEWNKGREPFYEPAVLSSLLQTVLRARRAQSGFVIPEIERKFTTMKIITHAVCHLVTLIFVATLIHVLLMTPNFFSLCELASVIVGMIA